MARRPARLIYPERCVLIEMDDGTPAEAESPKPETECNSGACWLDIPTFFNPSVISLYTDVFGGAFAEYFYSAETSGIS